VVLAISAGALRQYLQHHEELPNAPLVAIAPINARTSGRQAEMPGNNISAMSVALPTYAEDPLDRLFAFLLQKKDDIRPQNKRIVVIDPGHGGQDPGVLGPEGVKEKSLTLTVAHRLEKLLKMHQDAPVVLTRNDDYTIDLPKRLEIVAESGADVMLSLHAQMYFRTDPQGVMLFVQSQANWTDPGVAFDEDTSLVLAEALKRSLQAGGFKVHPVQELPVLPLGQGNLPRVMIEMGNLGNALDLSMLQDDTRQQDFARALFDGLNQFLTASQGDR
jgi:N-acetylmuramoyl-L-alanine amidase